MSTQSQFVALLRGVNVGGRKVGMGELKSLVEQQGFGNVSTLLQSGNVVLEAAVSAQKVQALLEKAISQKFDYSAKVFVHSMVELAKIVKEYPFDASDTNFQQYVIFVQGIDTKELATLQSDKKLEALQAGNGVVYWKVRKGYSIKSTFSKQLTKATYKNNNTVRNLNTLQKILAAPFSN